VNKKLILGAAAALAFAGCVSAVPLAATAIAPTVCVTSVVVGSGQILSRCPGGFRVDDRRGVSPGAPP
jgi:hypothetical protein